MGGGLTVDSTLHFPYNCHQLPQYQLTVYLRRLSKFHELSSIEQETLLVVNGIMCIYVHDINLQLGISGVEVEGLLGARRAAL